MSEKEARFEAPLRGKKYTKEDFVPYIRQLSDWHQERFLQLLPNLEVLEPKNLLYVLSINPHMPCLHGHIRHPESLKEYWGTIWMDQLQSGGWDATGYVSIFPDTKTGYVARFALCKHEERYLPTAKPQRGLHDKFCTKCGLNTSYDSSD